MLITAPLDQGLLCCPGRFACSAGCATDGLVRPGTVSGTRDISSGAACSESRPCSLEAFVGWWMVRSGLDPPETHTPSLGQHQRTPCDSSLLLMVSVSVLACFILIKGFLLGKEEGDSVGYWHEPAESSTIRSVVQFLQLRLQTLIAKARACDVYCLFDLSSPDC